MTQEYTINDLLTLMARLREPQYGCPWDIEQTYKTIAPSTIEEAYEVIDAIESEDYPQLKEELGDLLFQVIFYSEIGREQGHFDFAQIVSTVTEKLLRRHPHVFPDGRLNSRINLADVGSEQRQQVIKASWENIKQQEREQKGYQRIMDDVPRTLPATTRSVKLQKRAALVGFDWDNVGAVYPKIEEEMAEVKEAVASASTAEIEEEIGDLLFSVINLSRHLKVDPETALRRANSKFEQRFNQLEDIATEQKTAIDQQPPEVLEQWWQQVKQK